MFNQAFTHFFIHFDQDSVYIVENTGRLLDELTELSPAPNLTEIILSYSNHLNAKGHVQFTSKVGLQFYHIIINKNNRSKYLSLTLTISTNTTAMKPMMDFSFKYSNKQF